MAAALNYRNLPKLISDSAVTVLIGNNVHMMKSKCKMKIVRCAVCRRINIKLPKRPMGINFRINILSALGSPVM